MSNSSQKNLSFGSNLKIGLFHLGSGMADVLATGVWNRIMVADLGYGATIVGLLTGMRYFLAPLGVWAGRYSDTHTVGGFRRLFWIWLGRAMMTLSTVSLGYATAEMLRLAQREVREQAPFVLWLILLLSFLLFSLGNALSGSTFLALIHDRAAPEQRGRAVGLVWTMLLLGFTVGGVFFSLMLPHEEGLGEIAFSARSLQNLFLVTAVILGLLWFFSLLGEETRNRTHRPGVTSRSDQSHARFVAGMAQSPHALFPLLPDFVDGFCLLARTPYSNHLPARFSIWMRRPPIAFLPIGAAQQSSVLSDSCTCRGAIES